MSWVETRYTREPDARMSSGEWVIAVDPRWPGAVAYGETTGDADVMLDSMRADCIARGVAPITPTETR